MNLVTMIGLAAGTLTTCAFLPQAIKIMRDKETKGISLVMYLMFCAGISLWLTYGILIRDLPVIAANGVTLVIAIIIVGLKIRYG